jgi:adenylate cyclase
VIVALAVLGALVVVEFGFLVWAAVGWRASRRRVVELERSFRPAPRSGAVATAGRVARTAVQQAARLREHGVSHVLSSSLDALVQWASADRERIVRVADKDGIVTLFFSDIINSTALNEQLGDAEWVGLLADHDRLVRREIERRDGVVVKTIGDGFMAVFGNAESGVRAALDIHDRLHDARSRRLRNTRLSVRIGLHTGTAVASGDDYFGRNVALCARIAEHAVGGQTLISSETLQVVSEAAGLSFSPQGQVTFKGITDDVETYEVSITGNESA